MDGTKPWYLSTGVMGPLVAIIAWAIRKLTGVEIGPADLQPIIDNALLVLSGVLGVIGRVRATTTVTATKQEP